jgi:hypothetical protein
MWSIFPEQQLDASANVEERAVYMVVASGIDY